MSGDAGALAGYVDALAAYVREGRSHDGLRLLMQWVDEFRTAATTGAPANELAALCAEPPVLEDARWDALVAGVVLHWTRVWGAGVPAWAEQRAVRLEEPFHPAGDDERARRRAEHDPITNLSALNIWLAQDWSHTA